MLQAISQTTSCRQTHQLCEKVLSAVIPIKQDTVTPRNGVYVSGTHTLTHVYICVDLWIWCVREGEGKLSRV